MQPAWIARNAYKKYNANLWKENISKNKTQLIFKWILEKMTGRCELVKVRMINLWNT
jgi:hypothetical protein